MTTLTFTLVLLAVAAITFVGLWWFLGQTVQEIEAQEVKEAL